MVAVWLGRPKIIGTVFKVYDCAVGCRRTLADDLESTSGGGDAASTEQQATPAQLGSHSDERTNQIYRDRLSALTHSLEVQSTSSEIRAQRLALNTDFRYDIREESCINRLVQN